ncbi:MAG: cytochrome c biogenesis protein CcsA [Armatimonadota bacterium]|nr:cytochrome c biogenesis protein CcsA [Armatimonadota bacterium]
MVTRSVTGKIVLGLWIAGMTVAAFLWLPPAQGFRSPETARIVVFHVPCAIMAFVAFLLNGFYSWRYLRQRELLLDAKASISAELGLLFSVLATVTGSLFAMEQWGTAWNWDPRETSIVILMLVYAAYFALRGAVEEKEKRARLSAAYALLAFPAMVFLIWVFPRVVESLHPENTLFSRSGLDARYRVTLWGFFAGLLALFVWMFRTRLRLELLEARWRERRAQQLSVEPTLAGETR